MGKLRQIERRFSFGVNVFYNVFRLFPLLYADLWKTLALTGIAICAAVGNEIVNYKTGVIPGKFYVALIEKDEPQFWKIFWIASGCYIGLCLIMSIMNFFSWLLYIQQRKNLVQTLHCLYFNRNTYYKLNAIDDQGIDNPDQRITQDADKFTKLLATSIIPTVLLSPFIITYYSIRVWQTAGGWGVGMIVAYFLIGVIINRLLIGPLTPWAARVERAEGDFRYKHVSVRVNAEESAFMRAANFEHVFSDLRFAVLIRRLALFVCWKFPSQFFQSFFDYYGGCMSYILQLFPIFVFHMYDNLTPAELSGQISNNAFYFIYLINCFTRLTDLAMNLGEMGGYVMRISELVDASQLSQEGRDNEGMEDEQKRSTTTTTTSMNLLEVEHLLITPPTNPHVAIIENLSFSLPHNQSLLITGESGVGKTSILRAISGLWPHQGTLRKGYENAHYLPQRPYFPVGRLSLKQQLVLPETYVISKDLDERIVALLHELKLAHLITLVGNIDDEVDFEWQDTLSPGEQQRLVFARMVLAQPQLVFLDEATCNVDEHVEQVMFAILRRENINYISVGHRQSLRSYHDYELRIPTANSFIFHQIIKI